MDIETRNIINFEELPLPWQTEAIDNLDHEAYQAMFLEPTNDEDPAEHVLWDLVEAMPETGQLENGFKFNAVIGISNNLAMVLNIASDGQSAEFIII